MNDRDGQANRDWVEREGLPFPILLDPGRAIAASFGMSKPGDERYLANPAEGRRPAVVIDEAGYILKLLPDLATVDGQLEVLNSL